MTARDYNKLLKAIIGLIRESRIVATDAPIRKRSKRKAKPLPLNGGEDYTSS